MLRLSIGLQLPPHVRATLQCLAEGLPGARWLAPEDYHVALRSIGEVDEGVAEDIDAALDFVVAPIFDVALSGLGVFGEGDRFRVLWVGVAPNEPLRRLHGKINAALARIGLPASARGFAPHVALARLMPQQATAARIAAYIEERGFAKGPVVRADAFWLYERVRRSAVQAERVGAAAPSYAPLRDYPLGGWPLDDVGGLSEP
jgi:RNA 2',3'-cyclic 3'-phosphodiesterase